MTTLNNTVKTLRAWNGKLEHVGNILYWLYDKDILTATEKKQKDTVFNSYYRYYNDGDHPRGLKTKDGLPLYKYSSKQLIEESLEIKLETFIKKILKKYNSKIDRSEIKKSEKLKTFNTLINVSERNDVYSLINYWEKDVKDANILELIESIKPKYAILDEITNKAADAFPWEYSFNSPKGKVIVHKRQVMHNANIWTEEFESQYQDISTTMQKIAFNLNVLKNELTK